MSDSPSEGYPNYDPFDHAWKIYNNNQNLIQFFDQKIKLLLLVAGVLTSFVFNNLKEIQASGIFASVIFVIYMFSLLMFLVFSLLALFARKSNTKKKKHKTAELIYFKNISSRKSAEDYYESFINTKPEDMLRNLCDQIYEIGHVANIKMKHYKFAWNFLAFVGLSFVILMWGISI